MLDMNGLECEVVARLADRLVLGRQRYGPLTLEKMKRLTVVEQAEETMDRLAYAEFAALVEWLK